MKCVVCELPVRLTEMTTPSQATAVSASALREAVGMLGGQAGVDEKIRALMASGDRKLPKKKPFESAEDLSLSFQFSPDNPFSHPIYASRQDAREDTVFLYNHSTGKVEDARAVGVLKFNTLAPFETMVGSLALPQWESVLQDPMQAQSKGSSSSDGSADDSSRPQLQPVPIYVGVWANTPRDLLDLVAKGGRNSDAGESTLKNKRARKTVLDATTTVFKLHGTLPVPPKVPVNISSRLDHERKNVYGIIQDTLHEYPIITRRWLELIVAKVGKERGTKSCGPEIINDEARKQAFCFFTGPWKNCFVRFGYDPRRAYGGGNGSGVIGSEKKSRARGDHELSALKWPHPGLLQNFDRRKTREEKDIIQKLLSSSSPSDQASPAGKLVALLVTPYIVQLVAIVKLYPGLKSYIDEHIHFRPKCAKDGWLDLTEINKIKIVLDCFLDQAVKCMKAAKKTALPVLAPSSSAESSSARSPASGLSMMDVTIPPDKEALRAQSSLMRARSESARDQTLSRKRRRTAGSRGSAPVVKNTEAYDVFEQPDSDGTDSSWDEDVSGSDDDEDDAKQDEKANSPFKRSAQVYAI